MAPRVVRAILRSRGLMWLVFLCYFALFLAVDTASRVAGDVILVAGTLALAITFLAIRPRSGRGSFSTHCQQCDASLQGVAGFPRATCAQCGHRQSWARSK
ncbi:MAG: hypothetical protein KGL23_05815 [Acidobacteriota bacterium]|nr:hypothetical protein [Acidobacteriota bacterium]MDE3138802.1 hypothetical protein [Acidobacteriota bacterium]MDE3146930.1 hypothetical protein [Acidobacteriota bacterium]